MEIRNKKIVDIYNRSCADLGHGWSQYIISDKCVFDNVEYNQELQKGVTAAWLVSRLKDMEAWHRSRDCPEYVKSFSKDPKKNALARRYANHYKPWYNVQKRMQRLVRSLQKLPPDSVIASREWRAQQTSSELKKSWNKMLKGLAKVGLNFTGGMETDNLRKGQTVIYIMNVIPYDTRAAEAEDRSNDYVYIDNCIAKIYNNGIEKYGKRYSGYQGKELYNVVQRDVKKGLQRVVEANNINLKRLGNWDAQMKRAEWYAKKITVTRCFQKFLLESGAVYEIALDQDNYNALYCIKIRFKIKEAEE